MVPGGGGNAVIADFMASITSGALNGKAIVYFVTLNALINSLN